MLGFRRSYLEPIQLQRLKSHKYTSQGTSLLEVFFQPYWCWLVTKVPLWLAPNLITFIGLLINIFTSLPVALLDSNAQGLAPSWAYFVCAVGFFLYQSLDAIDGKQARRTHSSSQLGELFDHGCDAIATFIVTIIAASSVGCHDYPRMMLFFIVLVIVLNFCYHWQTYVSGVLHFNKIDVTEAQLLQITMMLITGSLGLKFWMIVVPYLDVSVRVLLVTSVCGFSIVNLVLSFSVILTGGVGKNGSTVADTSVLSPLLILFFQVPVIFLYTYLSPEPLNQYCNLFCLAMIFPLVKSIILIVVASMTKSPMHLFNSIMLGPLLAFANIYFNTIIPEVYLLTIIAVYNVVDVTYMCVSLCQEICAFLNISCFTIPPPAKQATHNNSNIDCHHRHSNEAL